MLAVRCLRSMACCVDASSSLAPSSRYRYSHCRAFTTTPLACAGPLPPRRPILDSEITEKFLKGSGPGGQKINKTSSAVQLIHHPTGIVVKYQDTRSRELNRKRARRLLQDRLEELELGDDARTRVKAREKSKKKASSGKKSRRKYRALEEGKQDDAGEADVEEGVEGEGDKGVVDAGGEAAPSEPAQLEAAGNKVSGG
ncbi:hypothetical protein J1614_000272 [Plenodomus biglobosus]|nr:hypothetical protein J1614_000272 [Plenodomus biglobosus]